jgi:aryl-alcohol dehydrogenase-like predicted oxidoreductase
MRYGTLPGVNKKISRLVMGMDNQGTLEHAARMYDDFLARGGNCFDTAYIYGGGLQEKLFGQWVRMRDVRDQVVLIDKGAHAPHCNPEAIRSQLAESLERLQMDTVDIYFMHRDNPEIPVGEFVDVLNDLKDRGRVGAFGGSNWTLERFEEANAWARANGKTGFTALSNNFSLARMVEAVWGGCLASSAPRFRQWHEETQTPCFAWSSQARGFFVPERAHPDKREDESMVRSWYSEDNFQRQARCFDLAEKKGVEPVVIALAYVLHQPFPVFPLIGPRQVSETESSFRALDVTLTPGEVKWLNLEADTP